MLLKRSLIKRENGTFETDIEALTYIGQGAPVEKSVLDYISNNFDLSKLCEDILESVIPDWVSLFFQCPVNVKVIDENGKVTGYDNGSYVADIPGSLILTSNFGDDKQILVPNNGSYQILVDGYEKGVYNSQFVGNIDGNWRIIELSNVEITNTSTDTITPELIDGIVTYSTNDSIKDIGIKISYISNFTEYQLIVENISCIGEGSYKIQVLNWTNLNSTTNPSVMLLSDQDGDGIFDSEVSLTNGYVMNQINYSSVFKS